jgi:hypothetical protein
MTLGDQIRDKMLLRNVERKLMQSQATKSRSEMLSIEFVGGPYDGYQQSCLMSPSQLPSDVIWFVCDDGLRLVGGGVHEKRGTFTSVALYEIDWATGTVRYRFAGAISAKAFRDSLLNST